MPAARRPNSSLIDCQNGSSRSSGWQKFLQLQLSPQHFIPYIILFYYYLKIKANRTVPSGVGQPAPGHVHHPVNLDGNDSHDKSRYPDVKGIDAQEKKG